MKYTLTDGELERYRTPCLVTSARSARRVARALGEGAIFNRAMQDFKDTREHTLVVNLPGNLARLLVIGGADSKTDADGFRKLATTAATAALRLPVTRAVVALDGVSVTGRGSEWKQLMLAQALSHGAYRYAKHKSKAPAPPTLNNVRLHVANKSKAKQAARLSNALDQGLKLTKDLGNEPPNVCNPTYLLKEARKLGRHPKVRVTSLDEKKMEAANMGAFLSVTRGTKTPAHMIIIRYNGTKASTPPISLVGKGITFDTGGISIKPPGAMDEMKFDMCGAAAVLGRPRPRSRPSCRSTW